MQKAGVHNLIGAIHGTRAARLCFLPGLRLAPRPPGQTTLKKSSPARTAQTIFNSQTNCYAYFPALARCDRFRK